MKCACVTFKHCGICQYGFCGLGSDPKTRKNKKPAKSSCFTVMVNTEKKGKKVFQKTATVILSPTLQ